MFDINSEGIYSKQEETYFKELKKYIDENQEEHTEWEFLKKRTLEIEQELAQLKNISDEEIINELRKNEPHSNFSQNMTFEQYDEGLKTRGLKHYKKLIPATIINKKWLLSFYKTKFNRFWTYYIRLDIRLR